MSSFQPVSTAMTVRDLRLSLQEWRVWTMLAMNDIRQRYRRSLIGPFWLTLSMGIMVGALGFMFSGLFKQDLHDYLPFLAVSLMIWGLIAGLINDGCATFTTADHYLKQMAIPKSLFALRVVLRGLIIFAHNFVIYVIVVFAFGVPVGWGTLLAIPGLLLIALNGFALALAMGLVCARFRDMPQIITNLVQVLFFVTPVIWQTRQLSPRMQEIMAFNPLGVFIEIVRAPLLGHPVVPATWGYALALTALSLLVSLLFFRRFRWRLTYWL